MLTVNRNLLQETYQQTYLKALVSSNIWNRSTEADLEWGSSARRAIIITDQVLINDIIPGVDRALYDVSDDEETITVDTNKGTDIYLSYNTIKRMGPLDPSGTIADIIARKMAVSVDADVLYYITQNPNVIDNGIVNNNQSDGNPIVISDTNVIKIVPTGKTYLRRNNINLEGGDGTLLIIIDSIAAQQFEEYIASKQNNFAAETFVNGYMGTISGAKFYISENLPGQFYQIINTQPVNGDSYSINGFTFTFKTTLTTTPGDVLIGANPSDTRQNLIYAILQSKTAGIVNTKYIPWTGGTAGSWNTFRWSAINDNTGNRIFVTGRGTGRITLAETGSSIAIDNTKNWLLGYIGLDSTIDIAIQRQIDAKITEHPFQEAIIIRFDYLYGIKLFRDRLVKFFGLKLQAWDL